MRRYRQNPIYLLPQLSGCERQQHCRQDGNNESHRLNGPIKVNAHWPQSGEAEFHRHLAVHADRYQQCVPDSVVQEEPHADPCQNPPRFAFHALPSFP
jgi:hypothetical protein